VHEGKDVLKRHSLLGMLKAIYRPQGIVPRLVHRLDKDTSGMLIAVKKDTTARRLEGLFASGDVDKEYVCLLVGRLQENEGTIDLRLPGREGKLVRSNSIQGRQEILGNDLGSRQDHHRSDASNPCAFRAVRPPGRDGRPARGFFIQ